MILERAFIDGRHAHTGPYIHEFFILIGGRSTRQDSGHFALLNRQAITPQILFTGFLDNALHAFQAGRGLVNHIDAVRVSRMIFHQEEAFHVAKCRSVVR